MDAQEKYNFLLKGSANLTIACDKVTSTDPLFHTDDVIHITLLLALYTYCKSGKPKLVVMNKLFAIEMWISNMDHALLNILTKTAIGFFTGEVLGIVSTDYHV